MITQKKRIVSFAVAASLCIMPISAYGKGLDTIYAKVSFCRSTLRLVKSEYIEFVSHMSKKEIYMVNGIQVSQNVSVAHELDQFQKSLNDAIDHLEKAMKYLKP